MDCNIDSGLANLGLASHLAERRRAPRFDLEIRLIVRATKNRSRAIPGWIMDVSCDGIKASIAAELEVGDVLELEFGLPSTSAIVRLEADVRWRAGNQYGLQFRHGADADREKMAQVFAAVGCSAQ